MKKCRACKSNLVDGPPVDRSARIDNFSCVIKEIPTKRCPMGCPGHYWTWLDFGVEVLEALSPDAPQIARRKWGLFKTSHYCRTCNVELVGPTQESCFEFQIPLRYGTSLQLSLTAPSLTCPSCQHRYLPAQSSRSDPFYGKLADVISKAITTDLIYE